MQDISNHILYMIRLSEVCSQKKIQLKSKDYCENMNIVYSKYNRDIREFFSANKIEIFENMSPDYGESIELLKNTSDKKVAQTFYQYVKKETDRYRIKAAKLLEYRSINEERNLIIGLQNSDSNFVNKAYSLIPAIQATK